MKLIKKTVYHYTSIKAFLRMLDVIKNNQFTFYASRIYELNDTSELFYGFKQIWEWLPQIEKRLSVNDNKYKLSRIGEWTDDKKSYPTKIIAEELKNSKINPFVISFSNNKDLLPMWSMYGDKGKGVALGFEIQLDFKEDNSSFLDLTAWDDIFSLKVSYGNYTLKDPALRYVSIMYSRYYDKVKGHNDIEKIRNCQLDLIDEIAFTSAVLLKHPSFNFEKESRIFYNTNHLDRIKFRINSKGNLIPFIEAPIPLSFFKRIVVGPCCDYIQLEKTLYLKFKQIGINDIKIEKSKVPYRDF